jgi:EAL domain-containing protein (putative c-di-GMP-specific phosphodiesterase class I)
VKEAGRNNYRFFHNEINDRLQERMAIENTFVAALNQNQFEVLYQPIFDENRQITCVEATIHWNKSDGTIVTPDDFLPLAEDTGFILQLGKWGFRTALTEIKNLQAVCGNPNFKVMVSVSAKQLEAPDFAEFVSELLKELEFSPSCLELEISEQVLISENEARFFALKHLRNLGVFIAIDDFGLSYATLLQLTSLPIGRLKIGRKFMENAEAEGKDMFTVISAVIAMAHSLSLKVTMSGLETAERLDLSEQQSGLERQGSSLSRPLHLAELEMELQQFFSICSK